jgi:hemerythrin
MYQYTRLHFQDEDRLMQLMNYPMAREHTRRHNDTLVHIRLLLEQIEDDTLDLEKWRTFLEDLFLNHMGDADLKFAAFITSQKRAAKKNAGGVNSQWGILIPTSKGNSGRDDGRTSAPGPL